MPILAELRARPFVLFALVLGVCLSWRASGWLLVFLIPLGFIADSAKVRLVGLALAGLGMLLAPSPVSPIYEKKPIEGEFRVISVPRAGSQSDWCLIEGEGVRYALFLNRPQDPTLISLGDRLQVRGYAKPFREGSDAFWLSKGAVGLVQFGDAISIQRTGLGAPIFRWGLSWRDSFRDITRRSLAAEHADLVDALCFNVDAALDPNLKDDLRKTGTVHIVSASGLHVMIFALASLWALSRLPVPRIVQLSILLFILFVYAGGTGFRPPVVRAVVMAAILLGGYLWRREGDLLSAAGIAACGQLLLDPWSVFDIGFYLSFVTIAALGLYLPPQNDRPILKGLQSSWIASLASAPIVGQVFGTISLISVVANLVIGIAILPLVAGTMLLWAVSFVSSGLAQLLAGLIIGPLASYLAVSVSWLASVPFASVALPPYSPVWIPVFYVLMLCTWRLRKRPAREVE